ncbi:MAG: sigma factor-like helix-turn-helix DNA-binding protein [Candidatus Sungiibacteriota bacterium]
MAILPAKRMRDVVERRFGLKGRPRATLEAIGGIYKITRERVRQIERDAMSRLRREEHSAIVPLFATVEGTLGDHGGVMAAHHLFASLASDRMHPSLQFLLQASPRFTYVPETDAFHARWAMSQAAVQCSEKITNDAAEHLALGARTISETDLRALLGIDGRAADAALAATKIIQKNPYGEYGLATWPTICPRGIKDKAYAALVISGKPVHFRDVSLAIDRAGWPVLPDRHGSSKKQGKKKAHPQTVHNELIKDKRFILVGRGMYALQDWGYEPGTVADVLVSVLKQSPNPLGREELITLAGERRMVKPQTILLNLQDKTRFKRTDEGKYTLV